MTDPYVKEQARLGILAQRFADAIGFVIDSHGIEEFDIWGEETLSDYETFSWFTDVDKSGDDIVLTVRFTRSNKEESDD